MYNDNILVLTYEGFSSCCPVCNWSCCQPLCQFCWLVCGLTGGKYVLLLGCVVTVSLYCCGGGDIRHYLPSDKCNYNAGTNPRPAELRLPPWRVTQLSPGAGWTIAAQLNWFTHSWLAPGPHHHNTKMRLQPSFAPAPRTRRLIGLDPINYSEAGWRRREKVGFISVIREQTIASPHLTWPATGSSSWLQL